MGFEVNAVASDSTRTQEPRKMGLVDVAPPNKGLGEILTGKELPKKGLVDVAPPNKGLLQVIIDWFK